MNTRVPFLFRTRYTYERERNASAVAQAFGTLRWLSSSARRSMEAEVVPRTVACHSSSRVQHRTVVRTESRGRRHEQYAAHYSRECADLNDDGECCPARSIIHPCSCKHRPPTSPKRRSMPMSTSWSPWRPISASSERKHAWKCSAYFRWRRNSPT